MLMLPATFSERSRGCLYPFMCVYVQPYYLDILKLSYVMRLFLLKVFIQNIKDG